DVDLRRRDAAVAARGATNGHLVANLQVAHGADLLDRVRRRRRRLDREGRAVAGGDGDRVAVEFGDRAAATGPAGTARATAARSTAAGTATGTVASAVPVGRRRTRGRPGRVSRPGAVVRD